MLEDLHELCIAHSLLLLHDIWRIVRGNVGVVFYSYIGSSSTYGLERVSKEHAYVRAHLIRAVSTHLGGNWHAWFMLFA